MKPLRLLLVRLVAGACCVPIKVRETFIRPAFDVATMTDDSLATAHQASELASCPSPSLA